MDRAALVSEYVRTDLHQSAHVPQSPRRQRFRQGHYDERTFGGPLLFTRWVHVHPVAWSFQMPIGERLVESPAPMGALGIQHLGLEEDGGFTAIEGIVEERLGVVERGQLVQRQVRDTDEVLLQVLAVRGP